MIGRCTVLTLPDSKLPRVGTTIFTVMSRLAEECGAINLSQGFPDFDPPPRLLELVNEAMRSGRNQYAPMAGAPELLEAIAAKVHTIYDCEVDPASSVTVTSGATEALFAAIHAVVRSPPRGIVKNTPGEPGPWIMNRLGKPLIVIPR